MTDRRHYRQNINRILAALCAALLLTSCGSTIESKPDGERPELAQTTTAEIKAAEETTETQAETVAETSAEEQPAPDKDEKAEEKSSGKKSSDIDLDDPFARSYALYAADSDMLISQKGMFDKVSLASTTKLLTASVMLKYLPADAEITVGDEVYYAKTDSTLAYLTPGMQLKVSDLLAAMLLPSGNDAAYTVAVNTARAAEDDPEMSIDDAIDTFVGLMNSFAEEIGMTHSHFANPEGWDDPGHYTAVWDMVLLADYVLSVPELREITAEHEHYCEPVNGGSCSWVNTNLFLDPESDYYRKDCIGLKTGTTEEAGCCLIAAFKVGGSEYICAVMGCDENTDRYQLVNKIMKKYTK